MATVSSSLIEREEPMYWYAMSVPYNRVLKVKNSWMKSKSNVLFPCVTRYVPSEDGKCDCMFQQSAI